MTEIPVEFTLQIQVLLGHDAVTFEGSKPLQKVRNHFPINNTASYHIGPEYSSTPLQEPQISQFNLVTDTLLQIKIQIFSNDSFLVLTPCMINGRYVSTFRRNVLPPSSGWSFMWMLIQLPQLHLNQDQSPLRWKHVPPERRNEFILQVITHIRNTRCEGLKIYKYTCMNFESLGEFRIVRNLEVV